MKKSLHPLIVVTLLALLGLAMAGVFFTGAPGTPDPASSTAKISGNSAIRLAPVPLVDEQPLKTAQRLAPLAGLPTEQEYAQIALRVADHEVDLAFAYALRRAANQPVPSNPEVRDLNNRLKELRVRAKSEQDDVDRLKQFTANAGAAKKDSDQQQLELAQAKLELTQDEIDDARQDLMRAGGDPQGALQRLLADHEASLQHKDSASPGGAAAAGARGETRQIYGETDSRSALAKLLAWRELHAKQIQLRDAIDEAKNARDDLATQHQRLEEQVRPGAPGNAVPLPAPPASNARVNDSGSDTASALSVVQGSKDMQLGLATLDKRIQDLQQLTGVYANWASFVGIRQRAYVNGLFWSAALILMILLLTLFAEPLLHRFYSRLAP